jgi:hypothetical protein
LRPHGSGCTGLTHTITPRPLRQQLREDLQRCSHILPLNRFLKRIDLGPQQLRYKGLLLGAVDEGVAGGLGVSVDQSS